MSIVFAALALSHQIEHQIGWSIKKFVRTARCYQTVTIRAGNETLTDADPLSAELHQALAKIKLADADAHRPKSAFKRRSGQT